MTQGGADYRADIDGLRAVAVVPVLLFHATIPGFEGGYVGVDIFFVISGYLIAGIIAREINAGSFSILHFYERRARRIMPALLAMTAAVLIAATIVFLPKDLIATGKSAAAAALFVSNIWFFATTGYFLGPADTMPLLHSWSLAVEEQFYIGFPLLLIAVARWAPRWRIGVVAACALASFAMAVATQGNDDGFAFYLSPPRAWELLVGALLALGAVPAIRSSVAREVLAGAGAASIAIAVLTYSPQTIFPGVRALLPVLGAAAVIHAGRDTQVARLLALWPLVAIGLVSYSLYLWHWPLIVFIEYVTDAPVRRWMSVAVIAASFALAYLSWRFIERPFRDPRRVGHQAIFCWTGAGVAVVCVAGVAFTMAQGWPQRFNAQAVTYAAAVDDVSPRREQCHDPDPARGRPPCVFGDPTRVDTIVWGDSYSVELAYALGERSKSGLVQQTRYGCPPVIGYDSPTGRACAAGSRAVLNDILSNPRLRTVYLTAYWARHIEQPPIFWQRLDATIARLTRAGRRVVLIGAVPPNRFEVPRSLAHRAIWGGDAARVAGRSRAEFEAEMTPFNTVARRWQARGVTVLDPVARLCPAVRCMIEHRGKPLYFDTHHLSLTGARFVVGANAHR